MLLQAPSWQANYTAMSVAQLVGELAHVAKNPEQFDEPAARKAFIAAELARHRCMIGPIIVLETD